MEEESDAAALLTLHNATSVSPPQAMQQSTYQVDRVVTVGELYPQQYPHVKDATTQYCDAFAEKTVTFYKKAILVGVLFGFIGSVAGTLGCLLFSAKKRMGFFIGWIIGFLSCAIIIIAPFVAVQPLAC